MKTKQVSLGQIVSTPNALDKIPEASINEALARHSRGDWGNVNDSDKSSNDEALNHKGQLLSSYLSPSGVKFWIITEWDRSVTTVLLPEDY